MKIVFMGTPEFAVPSLKALLQSNHKITAVFTKPDAKKGRGQKTQISAIKQLALEHNLPIYQPKKLCGDEIHALKQADIAIVAAYGLILPKKYLDAPKNGCINIHASLLPAWRGAAPIQRAIANDDKTTGISIMQMDEGLDTGAVLNKTSCAIDADETSISLAKKLSLLATLPLLTCLNNLTTLNAIKQENDKATYAKKINKTEANIDWRDTAKQIENNFRALQPWPGLQFQYNNLTIKIKAMSLVAVEHNLSAGHVLIANKNELIIAAKQGAINIQKLQLPNKTSCDWQDFYRGQPDFFLKTKGNNVNLNL